MKLLLSIFVITIITFSGYSQVPESNIIDSVYISIPRVRDTTVQFHSNSELHWIDSTGGRSSYEFLKGDQTYLEISITEKTEIKDAGFQKVIIVQFDPDDTSGVVPLSPSNTTWLIRNVWRYDPFERNFSGTLNFDDHRLEFDPWFDPLREILWDKKVIEHGLIRR